MQCTYNCNQGRACTCGMFHREGGRAVNTQRDEAPARYPFAPGAIEGPDTEDDFLRQQTVFHGLWLVGRWALLVIAIACAAMAVRGFFS